MLMKKIKVIVLRTAGTNCDNETAFAFKLAGAEPDLVHINEVTASRKKLADYHILAIPGGFTYGDDVASGKILANELRFKLEEELQRFINSGKLVIGICNGFQVLVKSGLLPNLSGDFQSIESTLTLNDSAKFESRWVYLKPGGASDCKPSACIWTHGMNKLIHLPVAHGEGKFVPRDRHVLQTLKARRLIVFHYTDELGKPASYPANPNGSCGHIAGICDPTGRVFGLMPHPERHVSWLQHPRWTRSPRQKSGDGLQIFINGVKYAKKQL